MVEFVSSFEIEVHGKAGMYIVAPCRALKAVSPPENVVATYEAGYEVGRAVQRSQAARPKPVADAQQIWAIALVDPRLHHRPGQRTRQPCLLR